MHVRNEREVHVQPHKCGKGGWGVVREKVQHVNSKKKERANLQQPKKKKNNKRRTKREGVVLTRVNGKVAGNPKEKWVHREPLLH